MPSATGWIFLLAIVGTLLMPVVLPAAAWAAPRGRRGRRVLAVAGVWVAVCALAGIVRLLTDDNYGSSGQTFWASATAAEQRDIVLLLAATLAGSAALLAASAPRLPRMATPALVAVSGGLLAIVADGWSGGTAHVLTMGLIAAAAVAAVVLSAAHRLTAAALLALVAGAFVPTLVMLAEELALGIH